MQIQFIRNIQFTKLVKADGRLREFNFRKSNGLQEGLFTVDVSDDRGNRIVLRMQREDGVWKIKDLGSSNGTYLLRDDFDRVEEGELTDGQEIALGNARFVFQLHPAE